MTRNSSFAFIATAALLFATVVFGRTAARRIPEQLAQPLSTIAPQVAGWSAEADRTLAPGVLSRLIPTSYLWRTYRKDKAEIDLFIAFYAQQNAGESMHSPKACLPGGGWEIWNNGSAEVLLNGRPQRINSYSIENRGPRMLMLYWYQSGSRIVANEYMGKILLARDTLLTGRTAGSIVRIVLPDTPGALTEGVAFASEVMPQVQRCFPGAGETAD